MTDSHPLALRHPNPRRIIACALVGLLLLGLGALWLAHYLTTAPPYHMARPPVPNPNAWDHYTRAIELGKRVPGRLDVTRDSTPPAQVAATVAAAQPALREFRAGLAYPCVVPLPDDLDHADLYKHGSGIRDLARLLAGEARLAAACGNLALAQQDLFDALRLGHQTAANGDGFIWALTGWVVEGIACRELCRLGARLDGPHCRAAARRLEAALATRPLYADALRREHGRTRESLARWTRTPVQQRQVIQQLGGRWLWKMPAVGREVDRFYEALEEQSKRPAGRRRALPPPEAEILKEVAPSVGERGLQSNDLHLAQGRLLAVELALRAFRLEHGRPAAGLAELVPNYLSAIPQDPYGAGEALRYRGGSRPFVYSVGPDGSDDGGRQPISWVDAQRGEPGDLVAQLGEH